MSYKDTSLWKRTIGSSDKDVDPLRESFLDARKNAQFLLDKIRKDFPNLTVHDITHVDSLWNVADTIIGDDYLINPLEGYVLGIAFLIHDAALSYDAVGGKDKLRDTIEWKDAYADGPGDKDEEEFKKECDFAAIRALHAKYAEDILNKKFERNNTTTFYIIDNDEYRTQFGDIIGKIAASHHWSIDEVESKLENQINPVAEFPGDWEINEQKLACILRCADAGHIDNGRAPFGIYNSLIVNGVSRDHWESQTRLGQVKENRKNPEQLLITSTRSFTKDNFAAWNVAYDAVRLFDEELKKSNELLKPAGLSFPHVGVTGAESKEALSKYIKTNGWQPCSFGVHTGNVKDLIERLGGSKLYGEDNLLLVVLRELIQNARDAIQARRTMDGRPEEGRIMIRLKEEEGKRWIEVEDDGIGMSLDCIKHNLLDFGSSYWKSKLAKDENPGLRSKGFKSIGKFGIGFYSVFMVAKSVEVITRRYKDGEDAKKIEFPEGLTLSPILSDVKQSTNVSTLVKFELKNDVALRFKNDDRGFVYEKTTLPNALAILVIGLDADVYFESEGKSTKVHENVKSVSFNKEEWLGGLLIHYLTNSDVIGKVASKLEALIDDNNELRGWLLPHEWVLAYLGFNFMGKLHFSNTTIGGLSTQIRDLTGNYDYLGFIGYVDGVEDSVVRNKMTIDEPLRKCLHNWVKRKYRENYDNIIVSDELAYGYCNLISFCGLNEVIADDNKKLIYAKRRCEIDPGTIKGLVKIHKFLFAGIDGFSGKFLGTRFTEEEINILFDSQQTDKERQKTFNSIFAGKPEKKAFYNRKWMEELMQISQNPVSEYNDIIKKYGNLAKYPLFRDGNKRTLGVWLNLMLNNLFNKMIDWGKVDNKNIDFFIRTSDFDGLGNYLNDFLSSTYADEMSASME